MILNGCYVSVALFCTVCNDVYSKMFIFGSIMDSRLPPCNAISEGRPPFSNTSSEEELIETGSDRKF